MERRGVEVEVEEVSTSRMVNIKTLLEVLSISLLCVGSDCYEKLKSGYRHYSGYYQSHLNVRDLEDCQAQCAREQTCTSLSYRSPGGTLLEHQFEMNYF